MSYNGKDLGELQLKCHQSMLQAGAVFENCTFVNGDVLLEIPSFFIESLQFHYLINQSEKISLKLIFWNELVYLLGLNETSKASATTSFQQGQIETKPDLTLFINELLTTKKEHKKLDNDNRESEIPFRDTRFHDEFDRKSRACPHRSEFPKNPHAFLAQDLPHGLPHRRAALPCEALGFHPNVGDYFDWHPHRPNHFGGKFDGHSRGRGAGRGGFCGRHGRGGFGKRSGLHGCREEFWMQV